MNDEHDEDSFAPASAPVSGTEVAQLRAGDGGRWLVHTQGSQHIWDLDAQTYRRLPGTDRIGFDHDGDEMPITKVDMWPQVGLPFLVWFDDPAQPWLEHWRRSSTVSRIERIVTGAGDDGPA